MSLTSKASNTDDEGLLSSSRPLAGHTPGDENETTAAAMLEQVQASVSLVADLLVRAQHLHALLDQRDAQQQKQVTTTVASGGGNIGVSVDAERGEPVVTAEQSIPHMSNNNNTVYLADLVDELRTGERCGWCVF